MSKRIRITGLKDRGHLGSGIYGLPTADNPTGEYPIGHEFDIDGDLPVGWKDRAVVVGDEPAEGSVFVGNDDDSEVGKAVRAVIEKAEAEFKRRDEAHAEALKVETDRANAAEARVAEMEKEAAERGPDPELIKAAVEGLDAKNDAHWTDTGLPKVDAVKEALGADVTRAQIEAAAPDAKRPE